MRITNGMMSRNLLNNLSLNMKRMNSLNKQATSGKLFDRPSDDPVAMARSLKIYTDISRVEQYERNVRDADSWLKSTEDGLIELESILQRARELAVDTSTGTKTETDAQNTAEEVKQLRDQVIRIANMSHAGRTIFTGYNTDKNLLNDKGYYQVDLDPPQVSVYNVGVIEDLDINTLGSRVFGVRLDDDSLINTQQVEEGQKSHMVDIFDQLILAMGSSVEGSEMRPKFDQARISELIDDVNDILNNTLGLRAEVGAKSNRLEMTSKRLDSQKLNFTEVLSANEDVDLAEVMMKFMSAESVYRASLSIGAKSIQPTLIDFLR